MQSRQESAEILASILGIPITDLPRLVRRGILPKPGHGAPYDITASVRAYITYQRQEQFIVTRSELLQHMKIKGSDLARFVVEGMPAGNAGNSNAYDLNACWRWLCKRYKEEKIVVDELSDSEKEEKIALMRARRQRVELETAERRSALVRGELGVNWVWEIVGEMSRELESMASRVASRLSEASNPHAAKRLVQEEIRKIKQAAADKARAAAEDISGE